MSEYWYLLSISNSVKSLSYGFNNEIYNTYYPALQLCVLYYKTGDLKKSIYYNNIADKKYSTAITKANKEFLSKKTPKLN